MNKYQDPDGNARQSKLSPREREELIKEYAFLVKQVAGRVAIRLPSSVFFDELISAGCLGLIDAVDKYDPDKNVNLKTYAEHRIKGAILDELRSMDWYSRSMRKKIRDIEKAVAAVEARVGHLADDADVAQELGLEIDDYYKILSQIHSAALLRLDDYIKDKDNESLSKRTFHEKIISDDNPSDNFSREEMKMIVAQAVEKLSEKEQMVLSLYYHEELTLKEIGEVMELTESRICQIHSTALTKLKSKLSDFND